MFKWFWTIFSLGAPACCKGILDNYKVKIRDTWHYIPLKYPLVNLSCQTETT